MREYPTNDLKKTFHYCAGKHANMFINAELINVSSVEHKASYFW